MNAFGYTDDQVVFCLKTFFQRSKERFLVKIRLRQINQHRVVLLEFAGKYGCCGQPAGMAAHDLNNGHHPSVIDPGVFVDLDAGGGDILGGGGEAGAVVGSKQVVVDGLGHAHHAALIADLLHVLADLVAGVHGVVAAVVEEVAHVVLLEDL